MNDADMTFPDLPERTERLLSRALDGELTADERVELDGILSANTAARALFEDYGAIDALASAALKRDFSRNIASASHRRSYRGWWIGVGGGLLAAAAVVALSVLTSLPHAAPPGEGRSPIARSPARAPMGIQPQFVDYRDGDLSPTNRQINLHRDLIGIRSADQNKIYIIERARQSTNLRPISGDI